jgi:hypothetical protein
MLNLLDSVWYRITDRNFWIQIFDNGTYMMLFVCTILFIWLMFIFSSENASVSAPSASTNPKNSSATTSPPNRPNGSFKSEPTRQQDLNNDLDNCPEMNKQNYDHFVKHLPNGYRTILLIVNNENKKQLMNLFQQITSKYKK